MVADTRVSRLLKFVIFICASLYNFVLTPVGFASVVVKSSALL